VKYYIWGTDFCGAETWTLRKADGKYLEIWNVVLEKDGRILLKKSEVLHNLKEESTAYNKRKKAQLDWLQLQ